MPSQMQKALYGWALWVARAMGFDQGILRRSVSRSKHKRPQQDSLSYRTLEDQQKNT